MEFKKGDKVKISPDWERILGSGVFGEGFGEVEAILGWGPHLYGVQWKGGGRFCHRSRELELYEPLLENI